MFLEAVVSESVNWSYWPHRRVQMRNPVRINLRVPEKVRNFVNVVKLSVLCRPLPIYRT